MTYVCSDSDYLVLPIARLQPDPGYPIDAARLETVREAMATNTPLPALVVRQWKGKTFVIGGWHTLRAAEMLGMTHVPVRWLPPPSAA
jgi:hypothetical protein